MEAWGKLAKLAYPAGVRYGPDLNHPILFNKILRHASVALANIQCAAIYPNYIAGTKSGTLGGGIDSHIGPWVAPTSESGSAHINITNQSTNADAALTMAVIFRTSAAPASNSVMITNNSSGNMCVCFGASLLLEIGQPFSTVISSTFTLTASTPYFFAFSVVSGTQRFVLCNLQSGQIQTATASTTITVSTSGGTVEWGDTGTSGQSSSCRVAAYMFAAGQSSLPELVAWAHDPWSFWYPQPEENWVGVSAGGLPPGLQVFDTPIQPDGYNRELRNWAISYNPNLIGQDVLPFRNNPINEVPQRLFDPFSHLRSWYWQYNPNLIGKDVLPFRNNPTNELPQRLLDYVSHLRTWTWQYNPNLIGQDILPFRNQQEIKPGPSWRAETLYPNLLTGALQPLPIGKSSDDLRLQLFDTFAQWRTWNSSYNPNLIGQDVLPFRNQQEIKPGPYWRAETLYPNLSTNTLVGQDILPFRNQQEIKPGPTWRVDSIPQDLLSTLLSVTAVLPVGAQLYDLPLRLTDAFSAWRTWATSYNPNLIGQDVLPFRNQQETKPGPSWRADFVPPNQLPTLLQIINALPIGAQLYDLPQRLADPFAQLRTWAWSYNVNLIGQDVLPFRNQQEIKPGATWRPEWVSFYNQNLIGQDVLPFRNLQDVPAGYIWRADNIPQNLLPLSAIVSLPPGVQFYDTPRLFFSGVPLFDPGQQQYQIALFSALPVGQQYFLLPPLSAPQLGPTYFPQPFLLALFSAPALPLPAGQQYFVLPPYPPIQMPPTTGLNLLQSTLTPPFVTSSLLLRTLVGTGL